MSDLSLRMYFWATGVLTSLKEERGQDLIEYALFGGVLAVIIIAAGLFFAQDANNPLNALFNGIQNCIDFTSSDCDPLDALA